MLPAPSSSASPPPAELRPDRWSELEPASAEAAARLSVTVVIDGPEDANATARTREALEAQEGAPGDFTVMTAANAVGLASDLVILIRAGELPAPDLIAAHAGLHAAASDLVTLGAVVPESAAAEDRFALLADLTRDLTDRGHGLYLLAALGSIGVRADLLRAAGAIDPERASRFAESRLDLAHRLACAGGLFALAPSEAISPSGLTDDGLVAAAGAALAAGGSLDATHPGIATAIPLPPFRPGPSPRRLDHPAVAVELIADEHCSADEALASVEAILDGRLGDLELTVIVSGGHPGAAAIAEAIAVDPRARIAEPGVAAEARAPRFGTAPFRISVPSLAGLDHRTIADLHHMALGEDVGALHVTVPGALPAEAMIEVTTTTALARATRIAEATGKDPVDLIGSIFGERWVSGVEVSVLRHGVDSPHITEHGPLAAATDITHERTQHLRFRDRADDLDERVSELEQRTFAERLIARDRRTKAEQAESKLGKAGEAPSWWRLRPIRSRLQK